MAEEKDVRGLTNLSTSIVVPQDKIAELKAGLLEYDKDNPEHELKFAKLVHILAGVTLSVGDVSMGAVELKDGETDVRGTIAENIGKQNAVVMTVVDENGDPVAAASSEAEQVPGTAANSKVVQLGGVAATGNPVAVGEGQAVKAFFDEYGRQVIASYNSLMDALNVNIVNQALLNTLGPVTNLDGATSTGPGGAVTVNGFHNITVHFLATGTVDMTVVCENSLDGVHWVPCGEITISATSNNEMTFDNVRYEYFRTNITSHTSGTLTTLIAAGN